MAGSETAPSSKLKNNIETSERSVGLNAESGAIPINNEGFSSGYFC